MTNDKCIKCRMKNTISLEDKKKQKVHVISANEQFLWFNKDCACKIWLMSLI